MEVLPRKKKSTIDNIKDIFKFLVIYFNPVVLNKHICNVASLFKNLVKLNHSFFDCDFLNNNNFFIHIYYENDQALQTAEN